MKKFKSFLIVSVLLCLVFSAFACDTALAEDADTIKDVPPVTVTADPIMSNFMTFEYEESDASFATYGNLSELYGTLTSSHTSNLLVFRKETKDYMNKVTETFTVYSLLAREAVATFTHQYDDENYYRDDDFENPVLPASEMTVTVSSLAGGAIDYITVTKITNTPIDEELIEENSLPHSYSKSYSFEFYDAQGTQIATSKIADEARLVDYNVAVAKVSFGKTFALIDMIENKLIKTYDGDIESEHISYSHSNERYNYALNCLYGGVDNGSPIGGSGKIEVYTKGGTLVCEYVYSDYSINSTAYVLANGDIMIQYLYITDEVSCDFVMGDMNYDLQTLILDVETGKTTEVEFNYFVSQLQNLDELVAQTRANGIAITFNENNVRNVANAVKIENGTVNSGAIDIIFFDDLLNVNYVLDKMIPDQDLAGEFLPLSDGYILVDLVSEANAQAIVKNGQVVTYVPDDARVTEYAIITKDGIYDFSMNLVFDLSDDDYDYPDGYYPSQPNMSDYYLYDFIGKYAIYYVENFAIQIAEDEYEYKDFVMVIDTEYGSRSCYENATLTGRGDGYLGIYEQESGIYNIYGMLGDMCHLIESKYPVTVIECSDGEAFVADVTFDGKTQAYLFQVSHPEY